MITYRKYLRIRKSLRAVSRYINAANIARFMSLLLVIAMLVSIGGCREAIQFSPNETALKPGEKELNRLSIDRISRIQKDTIRFALFGDTQRFYDDLSDFTVSVNSDPTIDFVILAGDITDFGQLREYRWVVRELQKLRVPFVAVPGNHDMLANGAEIFKQMFGPMDFAFTCSGNRFVCLNTNSIENSFDGTVPDIGFLKNALSDSSGYSNAIIVSHIPPFDNDFDRNLEKEYSGSLSAIDKVRLSLHGHQHRFYTQQPYDDGITYVVSASMQKRSYATISLAGKTVTEISERTF